MVKLFSLLRNSTIGMEAGYRIRESLRSPAMEPDEAASAPSRSDSIQSQGQFAQSGCDGTGRDARMRLRRKITLHFNRPPIVLQDLLRWQHPIHGDGMAIWSRADDAQWTVVESPANDPDIVAADDSAADQTITFLVQRLPSPVVIQALQNSQFICVR